MFGVVLIYREQTRTVWSEVVNILKNLKTASELRVSSIDLVNPSLREEAVTDPLDFSTETFRLDLDVQTIAIFGPEDYFTVNGQGYQSSVSPQPTDGDFSPPSLPRTPVQHESPDFLREGRAPSGSDFQHSPYLARPADIRIPEVDHIRTRRDEPIQIPDEIDITGELPPHDINISHPPSPDQSQPRPDASQRSPRPRSRSPRARSRSPRRRSRSPRRRSRSPRRRSRSPRARSKSPRRRSRSPRARSRSPRRRSRSPRRRSRSPRRRAQSPRSRQPRSPRDRSPRLRSPSRPRFEQRPVTTEPGAPPHRPGVEQLDEEPSAARVLMMDERTGELVTPEEPDLPDLPTSVREPDELAVPQGFVTPGGVVVTTTPSPPKKRRRMAIDNVITLSKEVIKRNFDTGGRETLSERKLDEHYLKSAKDLFMDPTTAALGSQPLLELWKRNAVTTPEEYHSSEPEESGEGSPALPRSPLGESIELARRIETPSDREIPRAAAEGSGLFERSSISADFTPDLQDSGLKRDLSLSSEQGKKAELDLEPTAPRGRSSSILHPSIGYLSPILEPPVQEPSDLDEYMDIGDLPTLTEQPEITLLEERTNETLSLVTKALRDTDGPLVFSNLWRQRTPSRKTAATTFFHLLALHKEGVFEMKQRDPYRMTNVYILKGVKY
ncbi:unnamed protein product [Porites evermanni]|uniref:Rad21/Rec8-like protein C-terminal eukaryotic domain-containing protein n=1 Tax=Porites evermanni TaxID=104178 RepID=A0ABN8RWZ5_9CNID|nr:unnamed protein product [Porites evermanni]